MAWTAPRTWVVGELISAAIMNTHIRDNQIQLYNGMPAARVFHSVNQAINNNALTVLTFDTERFDNDTIHDGVNPTRLTCVTAGKYQITANIAWAANVNGRRGLWLYLNGATTIAGVQQPIDAVAGWGEQSLSTLYDLVATDFVETQVYQNSGGALNITASLNYSPEFMMVKVG